MNSDNINPPRNAGDVSPILVMGICLSDGKGGFPINGGYLFSDGKRGIALMGIYLTGEPNGFPL
jgi:hypothetical protein